MPNWCNNLIIIEGPADKIRALWDAATANADSGLCQALRPMPSELNGTEADGSDSENWYTWRLANWGTKWDVNMEGLKFSDIGGGRAQIVGHADSAWAPPVTVFQHYASLNEDCYLELKYFEPNMSFIGTWNSEGTDAFWENVGEVAIQESENSDGVLMELFEHFNVWYDFDKDTDECEDSETAD